MELKRFLDMDREVMRVAVALIRIGRERDRGDLMRQGAVLRESARRSMRADVRAWRNMERRLELELGLVDLGEAGA